jgi:hypothetical protein
VIPCPSKRPTEEPAGRPGGRESMPGCALGERTLASCQMCKSKELVSHFLSSLSCKCSTGEQQIVCTCSTDAFCTCGATREQRVASSQRVQCCAMQCVCARASKGSRKHITGRADTLCKRKERSRISCYSPQVHCVSGAPDQVSDDDVPIPG